MQRWGTFAAGLLAVGFCVAPLADAAEKHSNAEVLLFETDHLRKITRPVSLRYNFKKEGALEEGYEDSVEIRITRIAKDGGKTVSTKFLSGKRRRDFPPVEHAVGNPVLLYFLEREIREMQRLTGGQHRYFQQRIRLALADHAEVRAVTFRYRGRQLSGNEVRIAPYRDDPLKSRYEKYAPKYYVFTLSDDLPGSVYQIRAVLPGTDGGKTALMEEMLTFDRASEPAGKQ